jgi:Ca-activated chloride channel family protein
MRFADPGILYLLLLLPVLAGGAVVAARVRRRRLQEFAGGAAHLEAFARQVSVHRRAAKTLLLLLAAAAGIVAAARPQWGGKLESVERSGVDVVVALDASLSMAVEDVAPNRLEAARQSAGALIGRLGGDRVGLVTFAGRASLNCPLTVDHEAARLFLEAVDLDAVAVPGTALADALVRASEAFELDGASPVEEGGRAIVLFTDGENHEEGIAEATSRLVRTGVNVYAVGVGSPGGGPIPLVDADGRTTGFKKDREGRVVTSRLEEAVLEDLAIETGGRYYRATPAGLEIDEIVEEIAGLDAREFGNVLRTRYEERFHVPLAVALLALLAEALIPDRKRRIPSPAAGGENP